MLCGRYNHRIFFLHIRLILLISVPIIPVSVFQKSIAQRLDADRYKSLTMQCVNNHCVYLPLIITQVPEENSPGCRWPFNPGSILTISYKWGDSLFVPGSLWRNAFESGLSAWNSTPTPVWYIYNSSSDNIVNLYYDNMANNRGITYITCVGMETLKVEVLGNIYWDWQEGYTVEQRRGIATHELGHGLSIGHIPIDYPQTSLLYSYTPPTFFNTIYDPQPPDISLVNQIYP